jgi:hypothetical protein
VGKNFGNFGIFIAPSQIKISKLILDTLLRAGVAESHTGT